MTSKIKVDNIENQCGGAVVTKCGATTTISGSVVKADDIQAADGGNLINQCGTTITLGASGDTINLASGASQTGFGRTGTVDWDTTPKTAGFTAVSGNGYFCNTSGGVFTVNLPAGSAGAIVSLADYAATWQTNNLTVSPNGTDKIGSLNENAILNVEGQSVTFVYVDSTQGWINTMDSTSNVRGLPPFTAATGGTILTCGNYKIHVFTAPGTFCVSAIGGGCNPSSADYTVVAGGGGSGGGGGGGGAGGFRNSVSCAGSLPLAVQGYPITVGGGGATSTRGSNSIFSTITSTGGGGTGPVSGGASPSAAPGGSGGGGPYNDWPNSPGPPPTAVPGGTGNTPPVSPPQGNNGGSGHGQYGTNNNGSGGGGGAGAVGVPSGGSIGGGPGGAGSPTSILGSTPTAPSYGEPGPAPGRYFAGGGGGNNGGPAQPTKVGGVGGGGNGGTSGGTGVTGSTNMGGGGGATNAAGGSGIVVIRYKFQ